MPEITLTVREKDAERLEEIEAVEPTAIDQIEEQVMGMITRAYSQLPDEEERVSAEPFAEHTQVPAEED